MNGPFWKLTFLVIHHSKPAISFFLQKMDPKNWVQNYFLDNLQHQKSVYKFFIIVFYKDMVLAWTLVASFCMEPLFSNRQGKRIHCLYLSFGLGTRIWWSVEGILRNWDLWNVTPLQQSSRYRWNKRRKINDFSSCKIVINNSDKLKLQQLKANVSSTYSRVQKST